MEKTSVIYFSKDRPLQLELAITTNNLSTLGFNEYRKNVEQVVIYKASNKEYEEAYRNIARDFPNVMFLNENEQATFRQRLLYAIRPNDFVLFVTDDTVFVKDYSLKDCVELLSERKEVFGVSLRLGMNTTMCYPHKKPNNMPGGYIRHKDFLLYEWPLVGFGDFGYPLELSSSVYDTYYIMPILENFQYENPNELEWIMSKRATVYEHACPLMACYESSRAFSIPANKVRHSVFNQGNLNRVGTNPENNPDNLLKLFNEGYVIDIDPLMDYVPQACHEEIDFSFVRIGEEDKENNED